MFGWLSGAASVECTGDYDSTITAGQKGIITDPIEDVTPEKFEAKFWKWVENQPKYSTYETGRDCTGSKDTAMVVAFHIEVSGLASLLVTFKGTMYMKYYVKDGCYYLENYGADKDLKTLGHQTIIKCLTDPFRLEVFDKETGARRAGPFVKGLFENELKTNEIQFDKVEADQPSPTAPGAFSLIASGIDLESTEALWKKSKAALLEKGATEEADGSVKMESSGLLSSSTYTLTTYVKEKDEIVAFDCGTDATCKDVLSTHHTKVLKEPAVIERWVFPKASVTSDEKGAKEVSKVLGAIINID